MQRHRRQTRKWFKNRSFVPPSVCFVKHADILKNHQKVWWWISVKKCFHKDKTDNYILWRNLTNSVECCTAVWDSYHICIQRLQAVRVVGLPSLPRLQIFFLMFTIDPVAHCCICEVVCSAYRYYADICVQQTDTWICSTVQPQIRITKVWHGSSPGA